MASLSRALGALILLAGLSGCGASEFYLGQVETSEVGVRSFRLETAGGLRSDPIYVGAEVWAFGLRRTQEGESFLSWSGVGQEHEGRVRYGEEGLSLEGAEGWRLLAGEERLALFSPGARVVSGGGEAEVLANPRIYLGLTAVNTVAPSELASVREKGVRHARTLQVLVARVDPGSPAAVAGVQVGDRVVALRLGASSTPLESREGLARGLCFLPATAGVALELERGGTPLVALLKGTSRQLGQFRTGAAVSDAAEFVVSR